MEVSPKRGATVGALAMVLALAACGIQTWNPTLYSAQQTPVDWGGGAYLKVHMQSGELYVLDRWSVPGEGEDLEGSGGLYDADRLLQEYGEHVIPAADVALLETNESETVSRFAYSGLTVYSVVSGFVTMVCLEDPKSCFGSCPTFYSVDDPERPLAEGFSSSFARALEARDVDDLGVTAAPGVFALVMRNEAQETHAVRHARLLAVPAGSSGRPSGRSVQTIAGDLVHTTGVRSPTRCQSNGGDCLAAVMTRDDVEYASKTDPADLAAREEIILDFGAVSGDVGLVLTGRNSLVTTYVFYQSLAYSGRQAGELMAALERGEAGAADRVLGASRELGGIEVFVSDDGAPWEAMGQFNEAGPIAADRQAIPLGSVQADDLRVKLRMAQGSWRIDEASLVSLGDVVTPIELAVDSVTSSRPADPDAWNRLTDPDRHLVTVRGDEYRLWFTVPDGGDYELFLDTRGYYYEWMREGWLEEESAADVASVLLQPREALKRMAPGFKEVESEMERLFWSSRFRR